LLHQKKEVQTLLQSVGSFILFSLSVAAIVFYFYAEDIVWFLYSKKVDGVVINLSDLEISTKVFGFLLLSIVPMGVNYTYGALLTAKGEMKMLNWIAFFGVMLNVILNLNFIPTKGVLGATLSSVSTQYFCAILQILLCYKIMKFSLPYKHFLKFIFALALFTLATYGLHQISRNFIFMLFLIPLFVALLFVLKVVDIQQILGLIKNRKD
jgi:O-antigen/teichoic acid export membrane protein